MNLAFVEFTGSGTCFTVDFRRENPANMQICSLIPQSVFLQIAEKPCAQTGQQRSGPGVVALLALLWA